jgi:A/G-specific adenine glycosylase
MQAREAAYGFLSRTRAKEVEVLLERRSEGLSLMPGMWELPSIEVTGAQMEKALTLRHSITVTNYRVTIYDLGSQQKRLPKSKETRQWFRVRELKGVPLTGLARKALTGLRAWPVETQ